jgi:DNA-directed RNA polymerase specialized sigma24 family protein
MAIAKYKNFEILRETEIYSNCEPSENETDFEEEPPELSAENIVAVMVNSLPQQCKEILTLFYYDGKSLDEILDIRTGNANKNSLKSSKTKCMTQLKTKVLDELDKYNLKPYKHE